MIFVTHCSMSVIIG